MTLRQLSRILGYGVSALAAGTGTLILAGRLMPPAAPPAMRWSFGTVLVCYGIYRFLLVRMPRRMDDD